MTRQDSALRSLAKSSVLKNSATLVSGTIITQLIVFLFSPLLSRVFGMVAFGDLANFNAWVSILALVGNLRYEHAIIVAKGPQNTNRVIALSLILSIGSAVLYEIVAAALHLSRTPPGFARDLQRIILMIPLGVLVVSASSLLIQFNVKSGRFRRLAIVTSMQVVLTVVPQIALGVIRVPHALIIGTIVGYAGSAGVLAWLFLKEHGTSDVRKEMSLRQLRLTAVAYQQFPRFSLAADSIGVVVQQFVPVFVLALFSPAVSGMYSFGIRVVRVPMLVVATAVTSALRKDAGDKVSDGVNLLPLFRATVKTLTLLSLIPFLVVLLFGSQIFAVVFGDQWAEAGRVMQILSPGILLEFVAAPLSAFFLVTSTQRYTLIVQFCGFLVIVAALLAGKRYLPDFIATAYLVSAAMVTVNLGTILLAAKVARPLRAAVGVLS